MSCTNLVHRAFQDTPVAVCVWWEDATVFGDGSGGAFPRELAFGEMGVMGVSLGHASGRGDDSARAFSGESSCLSDGIAGWEPLSCTRASDREMACDACCWCAFVCFVSCHVWSTCGRRSRWA